MKTSRWMMILALVVVLSMLVAACGEDDEDNEENGDDDGVSLSESYSYAPADAPTTVNFSYPEGWVVGETPDGSAAVANSQAAFDAVGQQGITPDQLPDDAVAIQVVTLPVAMMPAEDNSPAGLINFLGQTGAGPAGFELSFGEASDADMSGADAAAGAEVTGGVSGEVFAGQYGENFVLVLAISNNYGDYGDTIEAMLGTISVEANE